MQWAIPTCTGPLCTKTVVRMPPDLLCSNSRASRLGWLTPTVSRSQQHPLSQLGGLVMGKRKSVSPKVWLG
eukprot:scaffold1057_cov459-Prasinococcus_capsulatus_cf.AAC.6